MIQILYVTSDGALETLSQEWSNTENTTLRDLLQSLSGRTSLSQGELSWFRNTLRLQEDAVISDGDRLVALRSARLSPAIWRAQRVQRVSSQYSK